MQDRLRAWRDLMLLHERKIAALGLLLGFLFDTLTANRPDQLYTNFIITAYFTIAAACIMLMTIRGKDGFLGPLPLITIVQFSFGNLTSALLVLYGRSGTLVGSGIFIGALVAFLVANEFLRDRYTRTHVQIATWFLLFLPYVAMITPVLWGKVGDVVFLVSGGLALFVVFNFVAIVRRVAPRDIQLGLVRVAASITAIYSVFTGMYFLNMLPPVPLSLTHIGIYHSLERTPEGNYAVTYEKAPWYEWWHDTNTIYNLQAGKPAYCFSSVFAPTGLSTPIFHRWERKLDDGSWQTVTYLSFPINGGRDAGYRGYSQTFRTAPGEWRCSVETERRTLVGRTNFIVRDSVPLELLTREL
ncbi:MAG: DUF2914 domain-containing protein [Candidatus Pacebacteria bacterium]|nr:DUF2914 domain-containing protein [Candidatus Paceibacterota bacterium]